MVIKLIILSTYNKNVFWKVRLYIVEAPKPVWFLSVGTNNSIFCCLENLKCEWKQTNKQC